MLTQLHEGNHCLLTQCSHCLKPFIPRGREQQWRTGEGRSLQLTSLVLKAAAKKDFYRQHDREMGISQHKEQVWSQPISPKANSREEIDGAWNKGCLYHPWRLECEEPQEQRGLGWGTLSHATSLCSDIPQEGGSVS